MASSFPNAKPIGMFPKAAKQKGNCGAKTRKSTACRNKVEPGKTRCKFHGGKSTGAKTAEGLERISEAQRRRWAAYRIALKATDEQNSGAA